VEILLSPHSCQPPQALSDGVTPSPGALFIQAGCETEFNVGNLGASEACSSGPSVALAQGQNHFRGPGYFDTDFAIIKNTKIPGWECAVLGIAFTFYNFFNHPDFGLPDNDISSPFFGQIYYMESSPTTALGAGLGGDASARVIQLKPSFSSKIRVPKQ
jgi:hypothetical protein